MSRRPGHQATLDERTLEVVSASPHLVTVREVDEHDGVAYQVYDFVPWADPRRAPSATPRPPEAFVADFVAQMCDAWRCSARRSSSTGTSNRRTSSWAGRGRRWRSW